MKSRIINGKPVKRYTDEWLLENADNEIDGLKVSLWELAPAYEGNFINPNWNGSNYVELATIEEVIEFDKSVFLPILQKVFSDNELKAKAFVIDKTGKKAYIESQERHYVLKYKVAKGLIQNAKITALHEIEAADLGITLEQLHYVIVWKYETAESEFENLTACNETCRTRIQTHLEQGQKQIAEDCLAIYQNLICEDFELLTNQILAL